MDNKEKQTFNYTYSAKQQEEIKRIRNKYSVPKETEDKMKKLRLLDKSATQKAAKASITIGSLGTLILGIGMSLIMSELGDALGINQNLLMPIGISIGIVGIILACCAYPIYIRTLKKQQEKIAPEIIRLTDELMK